MISSLLVKITKIDVNEYQCHYVSVPASPFGFAHTEYMYILNITKMQNYPISVVFSFISEGIINIKSPPDLS